MKENERYSKCKWYDICPIKRFTDQGLLNTQWVLNYCLKGNKECKRYQMEEKNQFHPDQMLPDGTIDESLPK